MILKNLSKDIPEIAAFINKLAMKKAKAASMMSRYTLSSSENPQETIDSLFDAINHEEKLIITEIVVFEEDAYLNTLAFQANAKHRRYFTVPEIISLGSRKGRLEFFLNIRETVSFRFMLRFVPKEKRSMVTQEFLQLPKHIKDILHVREKDDIIVDFSPNIGIFIFNKI